MNAMDIPDPVQDADGIPVVTGEALATNARLAWLHVRYTQLDPKHPHEPNAPHQAYEGVEGHIWYGSLSYVLKDLWPALRSGGPEEDPAAREASRRINQYLRGTNNMVCLDPGRMDPISRQRKTHRLPEWWVSDEWQVMTWVRPDLYSTGTATPTVAESEFTAVPADVFDSDIPLERLRTEDPELTSDVDPEGDETTPEQAAEAFADEYGESFACRVGCDREFPSTRSRAVHERSHGDVDALLDTMTTLLTEYNGETANISVALIASRAGTTRQAVHNHFKTKMGALRAAARLRGAPLIDGEQTEEEEHAAAVPAGFTEQQWYDGRTRLLALASFGDRNGTPLTARLLAQFPWNLTTVQREMLVDSLVLDGSLVDGTVHNAYGQTKAVLTPAAGAQVPEPAPAPEHAAVAGPAPAPDPVETVREMIARYERMERNELVLVSKVRDAESRAAAAKNEAKEAETVREELESLKSAVQTMRSAMLGLPL